MNKNLITFAILGAGAYFLLTRKKRRGSVVVPEVETISKEQFEQPDAVVNADKTGLSLPEALETAKNIVDKIKDAKIDIIKNGKKTSVRAGYKKVKLTKANKKFFKNLKMKGGKKLTRNQQKAVKYATTTMWKLR